MRPRPTLAVVIPVYNEVRTVGEVVARVLASPEVDEVLLVDDGSSDGSAAALEAFGDPRVRVLRHARNRGKGAALRSAFAVATAVLIVVQDADLEYDPDDFGALLRPIAEGRADVVYGSRYTAGAATGAEPRGHVLANRLLTWASNLTTGLDLTDMETCYKVFRRELLDRLRLRSERFTIEPELTAKFARLPGLRIVEVPISDRPRPRAAGKKIGWRDGIAALWAILRYRIAD